MDIRHSHKEGIRESTIIDFFEAFYRIFPTGIDNISRTVFERLFKAPVVQIGHHNTTCRAEAQQIQVAQTDKTHANHHNSIAIKGRE